MASLTYTTTSKTLLSQIKAHNNRGYKIISNNTNIDKPLNNNIIINRTNFHLANITIIRLIYTIVLCLISTMAINVDSTSIDVKDGRKKIQLTQHNNHANISELLDNLLRGYDNSIRPGFGGPPAVIEVDIMVRSMGPISEVDMTYSMDCYFRQSWVDRRLAFKGAQDTLALSISMLARIWKPDTYFYNGKQSYLHTITTPNKFVRLYQDGRVLYSSRLTIKAGCPMNLENFPMDIQRCPLKFGSFGYTSIDVVYRWIDIKDRQAVTISEDMKLSQFDLVDCPSGNVTYTIHVADQNDKVTSQYSMLLVNFHLQRHMGNFLIQVYGPCILLVVLSWVSFWLNREATADRVSLGITTVLTMTFLGLEARTDLPKVPYPTALDFFVFLSFAFIFATIIQFAVVHYFTKYGSGECYFGQENFDSESDCYSEEDEPISSTITINIDSSASPITRQNGDHDTRLFEVIPLSVCSIPHTPIIRSRQSRSTWLYWPCRRKSVQAIPYLPSTTTITQNSSSQIAATIPQPHCITRKKRVQRFNSVSKIDRASRILFPIIFFVINLFYWHSYLSKSERFAHADHRLIG